ncbi:cyclopropane-fatty-acyl-phospholipid synthase family protein [Oceanicola sp. 502str15]|uniref:SAM-dependent methyltransferase n=1 Tax=Oceanicola sp. 502str15 TaxID=2696061 RepID=UPI0020953D95|nr:cyclopropane-fatty-acyl-phospholipid synthase family protein [Oceanicola sp. 502str15]MCO6384113.1 methyltransferase domain-containing protein [Oceanicola sp. 502str15]
MSFLTTRARREFIDSCARITCGSLRLRTPEGEVHDFGSGAPAAEMDIHDWSIVTSLAARGDIGLGESYVECLWDTPSIETLAELALRNFHEFQGHAHAGFWNRLKFRVTDRLLRANSRRGASRNIRAHYDVGNEFYQLWLDEGMTYSSALYAPGDDDLTRAQNRKYDRILDRVRDAESLLEIGCGWGGFAERAAGRGQHVTGVTISPSQKGYADARLDGRAEIRLQDYRAVQGKYASIVSIEMIEAVGQRYWPTYFATLKARLAEGGRAVLQAITVPDENFDHYAGRSDYIRHYTFPGGMLLSDSRIAREAERAGLRVTDNHAFGLDYGRTCRAWNDRLEAVAGKVRALGYDERFLRNWRYYLGTCTAAFATGRCDVVQVELAHV